MGAAGWIAAIGCLLLFTSLTSGWIRNFPITNFAIYLLAGIAVGPWGLNWVHIDLRGNDVWLSNLTQVALVISLFISGLKLRLRFSNPAWMHALRLAFPCMLLTVSGVAAIAYYGLGQSPGMSLLLAALIAPTDPVLASIVAVDHAGDSDAFRVALSGEAGLNDGFALPFLLVAMTMVNSPTALNSHQWLHWFAIDVVWSLAAGLALGFGLGWVIGLIGAHLRSAARAIAPSDFLALALMALAYAGAEAISASSFLAAFAAGLGLRSAELWVVARHPHPRFEKSGENDQHPPAEAMINPNRRSADEASQPATSMGLVVSDALSFGDTLERLIASALVVLAGIACARYWSPAAAVVVVILFFLIRPLSVLIGMTGTSAPMPRRLLLGWIGIRGIGTLNYLAYALTHGLNEAQSMLAAQIGVTAVVLSILLHGTSAPPLMAWRRSRLAAHADKAAVD